jgi:hypothetical protein
MIMRSQVGLYNLVIRVVLVAVCLCKVAYARSVFVNGELLNQQQLSQLDEAHCMAIPDGRYWLRQQGNTGTWVWGYEATPWQVAGVLGEECGNYSTQNALGNRRDPGSNLWRGTGGDSNCVYTGDGLSTCF